MLVGAVVIILPISLIYYRSNVQHNSGHEKPKSLNDIYHGGNQTYEHSGGNLAPTALSLREYFLLLEPRQGAGRKALEQGIRHLSRT